MDPQAKAIFRYWNGDRWVWGDPLYLLRNLDTALGDPDAVYRDIEDSDPKVYRNAINCLIDNVRAVFFMPPINAETGRGATEEDCRNALDELFKFLTKKKTAIVGSPISVAPTTSSPGMDLSTTAPSLG